MQPRYFQHFLDQHIFSISSINRKSIVLAGKPVGKIKQLTSIKGRNIYKPVSEHREHVRSYYLNSYLYSVNSSQVLSLVLLVLEIVSNIPFDILRFRLDKDLREEANAPFLSRYHS